MLKRLLRDRRGASATEFAVIAPVLGLMALGMIDGWSLATSALNMHTGVQAGAKFLLQGGGAESDVEAVTLAGWAYKPGDADVNVTKACTCAGAAALCTGLCVATNKPTEVVYTISATGTWNAPFEVSFLTLTHSLNQTQVVRVR
jgi:Flp pilus assembly protein TadG